MQLFDIGANLTHSAFQADLAQTVERARAAGVTRIIVTGTTVDETMAASHVAEQFGLWATAGVHPHHARDCGPHTIDALRKLAQHPRVVAIVEQVAATPKFVILRAIKG